MLIPILSLTLLIPTLICGALAWVIWTKRPQENEDRTPANLLISIVLGCTIGTAAYALELIAPDLPAKLFLTALGYVGTLILMVAVLLFAIWYAGKWSWVTPARFAAISTGPVLILVTVATNSIHHLYYLDVGLDASYEIHQMTQTPGPLYTVAGAYILFTFAASLVLLMGAKFTIHRGYGRAWPALVVGLVVPLIAYVLYIAGFRPFGFLNLVPYSITVTAVALTLATLRFHVLDLRPVARETLIRDLPAGMMVFDDGMRIVDMNPSAAQVLGFGIEAAHNHRAEEFLVEDDPVLRFCRAGGSGNVEVIRDGRSLELALSRIPGHRSETIGYLLFLQDVTETKHTKDALRLANLKLKMLSGITRHDIVNQLTALRGYQQILRESVHDPALIAMVEREMSATNVISDLIRFTEEYEKIGDREPEWFSVAALVLPARELAAQHTIDLATDFISWEIFADPLISKVIFNLVDNAIRHGESVRKIRFSGVREGDDLLLVCEDDGVGVVPGMKERIFTQGVGKNTGLGLFFVREILSITGLSIAETGLPGSGARFEIRVPAGKFRES
jgi:PAS domain S-box-containing protein